FQAEDGIRDKLVTGVQTCALPICLLLPLFRRRLLAAPAAPSALFVGAVQFGGVILDAQHVAALELLAARQRVAAFVELEAQEVQIGRASCRERVGMSWGSGDLMNT